MNKNKFRKMDLITLLMMMIVYAVIINFLIDAGAIICAICSALFVVTFTILTVVDNLFENKKLNNVLKIICFILLALIVITFFI